MFKEWYGNVHLPHFSEKAIAKAAWDHQQVIIDRLMQEYCLHEMTPEQVAEWESHQAMESL